MTTWTLQITGMTCASCGSHLDVAFRALPGVLTAQTDWARGESLLTAHESVSADDLSRAVTANNYVVTSAIPSTPSVSRDRPINRVVVIGSGAAAMAAALHAAEAGHAVTMIERHTIGGTCVNVGCVPSKTLIRAAESLHRAQHTAFEGITVQGSLNKFSALASQRDALVTGLRQKKYIDVLAATPGVTVIHGEARFTGEDSLEVGDQRLTFDKCLVATGSSAYLPEIPGLADADPLDSTSALTLTHLPKRMVILGGRIIALELGQAFARLGVEVTIVQRSDRILPDQDDDLTDHLQKYLIAEGITIITGATVNRVEASKSSTHVHVTTAAGSTILSTDRILVAMGRKPNTAALDPRRANIACGDNGQIVVDEHLRSTNPRIYAAGDVIGGHALVYTAAYEGRLATANMLGEGRVRNYAALPWVIFTDPQVAVVGLTEREAARQGISVDVARIDMTQVPRSIAAHDDRGFLKLIKERGGDRLLGAVFLAPEAGDLIMEPTIAIRHGIGVSQLIDTFHPYLTQAEGVRLVAQLFHTDISRLSCCA